MKALQVEYVTTRRDVHTANGERRPFLEGASEFLQECFQVLGFPSCSSTSALSFSERASARPCCARACRRATRNAIRGISYFEGVGALNVQIGCSVIGNLPPEQSELNGIQLRSIEMGLQND